MTKLWKCANYKSVLRVQHPALQDWVWTSLRNGDHDDDDEDRKNLNDGDDGLK